MRVLGNAAGSKLSYKMLGSSHGNYYLRFISDVRHVLQMLS